MGHVTVLVLAILMMLQRIVVRILLVLTVLAMQATIAQKINVEILPQHGTINAADGVMAMATVIIGRILHALTIARIV